MKLTFTVELSDYDNPSTIEDKIVESAARQMINEVMNNRYEKSGKTFREKLINEVKIMMLDIMDTDFKEEVKDSLVDDLNKKYIKTKQYKEVKEQFDIKSDTEIKNGLKVIVSELVGSEMKKRFK